MKQKKIRKVVKVGFVSIILVVMFLLILIIINLDKIIKKDGNLQSKNSTKEIETLTDGTSLNTRVNFKGIKKFGDYEISNVVFTSNNNITTIIADIKNTSKIKLEEKIITLKLLDKQNNEIISLSGIVETLEPNKSTILKINSTINYIDAYDYIIN